MFSVLESLFQSASDPALSGYMSQYSNAHLSLLCGPLYWNGLSFFRPAICSKSVALRFLSPFFCPPSPYGSNSMRFCLASVILCGNIIRFCPYFGSTVAAAPSTAPSTANAGSLPLSPVTPMRPSRGGSVHASPARGSSPVTKTRGVHASPGAAAAARAVSSDLGGAAQALMTTPSRSSRRKGVGRSSSGNSGRNGVTESTGLLSFVCFSMGGE